MKIKYRVWDGEKYVSDKDYDTLGIDDQGNAFYCHTDSCESPLRYIDNDCEIEFFSQIHDKNGKEIFENDLVRAKYLMGKDKEWSSEALYQIRLDIKKGMFLQYVSLFGEQILADGSFNQIPINRQLGFYNDLINTDYFNSNNYNLSISDSFNYGRHGESTHVNWYSNDIEIVGNINQHKHLIKEDIL